MGGGYPIYDGSSPFWGSSDEDGSEEFGGSAVGKAAARADMAVTGTVSRGLKAIGRAIIRNS